MPTHDIMDNRKEKLVDCRREFKRRLLSEVKRRQGLEGVISEDFGPTVERG